MSKNNKNKQNKTNQEKLSNNKRKKQIISFTCIIILLILSLIVILISTNVKSDSKNLMKQFNNYFSSDTEKVILYYDSKAEDSKENSIEKSYLSDLSKQFKIDFLTIDISLLNKKDKSTIENKLGISGTTPSVIVTKNEKIISVSDGFIESHNLVSLLISSNVLKEDSKYKNIDNLKFIDYKKYKELLEKKDSNIIVVGQSGCEYCNAVKPILNNISKAYKVNIYYFDVKDIDNNDLQKFFDELPKIGYDDESLETEGSFSMPTVLITKKGKITSFLQGQQSLEKYIKYFKEQNVIE